MNVCTYPVEFGTLRKLAITLRILTLSLITHRDDPVAARPDPNVGLSVPIAAQKDHGQCRPTAGCAAQVLRSNSALPTRRRVQRPTKARR
jgi:hypothetical protein